MQKNHLTTALLALILVLAASLRLARLDSIPPGLTHDEADHGLDAAGVLAGVTPIYFTVGYGREPLYDYVTSVAMLVAGQNYMASRLTAVAFGMAQIVLVYAVVKRWSGDRWLALGTAAGLALSFWPISTSRQALRSITLPVLYMVSVWCLLRGIRWGEGENTPRLRPGRWGWFVAAGVLLGAMLYTYLAARIMWAVIPAVAVGLLITRPGALKRLWGWLAGTLAIASAVAAPLFLYLQRNPGAEVRLSQLASPLDALAAGDPSPLLANVFDGLAMITFAGDDLWLYNIPGRPLLNPLLGTLFYIGMVVALVRIFTPYNKTQRSPRAVFRTASLNLFMVGTFLAGISPALVTGAGASNVRVIGLQPALYYFPALAVIWMAERAGQKAAQEISVGFAVVLVVTAVWGAQDYFVRWANARDVRVAYHTTLVETLRYIDEAEVGDNVALSSITPGPFHDAAIAEMMVTREDVRLHWFDGRSAMVYPAAGTTTYFFPEVASPAPYFGLLPPVQTISLRPTDFNRTVFIFTDVAQRQPTIVPDEPIAVGGILAFEGYDIRGRVAPGETVTVATYWHVTKNTPLELVMFTQVLDQEGRVAAQQDYLGYPTSSWQQGDRFIQVHTLNIPTDASPAGLISGVYTLSDLARLPVAIDGEPKSDVINLGVQH